MTKIDPHHIKDIPAPIVSRLERTRESVFARFPLAFTLLGTFGVVATFYGFEAMIDRSELLSENPVILLGIGVLTLIFTGTLYKKLG